MFEGLARIVILVKVEASVKQLLKLKKKKRSPHYGLDNCQLVDDERLV
jgi:hypothetical protein